MTHYKRLAVHNSACNELFYIFQDCEREHPFTKVFGTCGQVQRDFRKCIKDLVMERQTISGEFSKVTGETATTQRKTASRVKKQSIMISFEDATDENSKKLDSPILLSIDSKITTSSEDVQPLGKEDDFEFPTDDDIHDMVKDVNLDNPLPTVTERYFTTYYRMNFPTEGEDICIRIHTNRLCMISLAPSHAIFQNDRKIEKIDFQVTEKLNRADNAVSGKAKHGAQPLHESSKICSIKCTNGETWIVRCGMSGKLTEANTDLLRNPELVRQPPHKGGYLAIVLPKISAIDNLKKHLVTQELYDEARLDRLSAKNVNGLNRANGTGKRLCEDNISAECREKIMKTEVTESEHKIVNEDDELLQTT